MNENPTSVNGIQGFKIGALVGAFIFPTVWKVALFAIPVYSVTDEKTKNPSSALAEITSIVPLAIVGAIIFGIIGGLIGYFGRRREEKYGKPKHRFLQLHLSAAILAVLISGGLLGANIIPTYGTIGRLTSKRQGFPFSFTVAYDASPETVAEMQRTSNALVSSRQPSKEAQHEYEATWDGLERELNTFHRFEVRFDSYYMFLDGFCCLTAVVLIAGAVEYLIRRREAR